VPDQLGKLLLLRDDTGAASLMRPPDGTAEGSGSRLTPQQSKWPYPAFRHVPPIGR